MDDVIVNKIESIERCLWRVEEEYRGHEEELETNFTRQDSIVLNLQRACEQTIDLGNHLVKTRNLGVPQTSRDSFELLQRAGIIDQTLAASLKSMVGFRNIAIHEYKSLDLKIVRSIIENHLKDFRAFAKIALKQAS